MKRLLIISIFVILVFSLVASEVQKPNRIAVNLENLQTYRVESANRTAPTVTFEIDPVTVATGMYYDYCPGSYNSPPIRKQPEFSGPSGYPADGYYHSFMFQETAGSQRRVYYSYITNDGVVSTPAAIGSENIREGFPSTAVDPETANPFVAWHSDTDGDNILEVIFSYDMFNVVGTPGLWKLPYTLIDNPVDEFDPYTQFIWPVVNVGLSPIAGKRRIHIYANDAPDGTAYYNCIYGYSDFSYNESTFDIEFDGWNFSTLPLFDGWQDNETKRAIKEIAVSEIDGKVAFVGHAGDSLFCIFSNNYGETFTSTVYDAHYDCFNPQNEDGTYYFLNDDGSPATMFTEPNGDGGHFNARFTDNSSKIIFMSAMGLNSEEGMANGMYFPAFFEPKIFIYDTETEDYSFVDLQVTGVDPYDDNPMLTFDLDEDGVVDEYYDDGYVYFADVWPSFFYAGDAAEGAFHYSNFKIATSGNWAAVVFQDGRNARQAYLENPDYEDWFETPEIAICISSDYGVTWSEPAYMNANVSSENYYSQLDGMIPEFVYATGGLEIIDDFHAKFPIVFLDDNSYGSANPNTHGQPNGGTQMFATLNVEFSEIFVPDEQSSDENTVPAIGALGQNYPNPFNPNTKIGFNLKVESNVQIDIYNIHGQRINTIANQQYGVGYHIVNWNGIDGEGRPVASGVYFYKMKAGRYTSTKKMILMK